MYVNRNEELELKGVSTGDLKTLGTCYADLIVKNKIMNHKFQVVPKETNTVYDGILGHDFLRKFDFHMHFAKGGESIIKFMAEGPILFVEQEEEGDTEIKPTAVNAVTKKDEERHEHEQVGGLWNENNSCYVNSLVQALYGIKAVRTWVQILFERNHVCNNINCTRCQMALLFEAIGKGEGSAIVNELKYNFQKSIPKCEIGQQQDVHEFLGLITERGCIVYPNDKSLQSLLKGVTEYHTSCLNCGYKKITPQAFQELMVYPSVETSVQNIIYSEHSISPVEGTCEKCEGNGSLVRNIYIEKAPEILTIKVNQNIIRNMKVHVKLEISEIIELPTKPRGEQALNRYRLVSAINHKGHGISSGHYTAQIFSPGNKITIYDDENVHAINQLEYFKSSEVCLLFYEEILENNEVTFEEEPCNLEPTDEPFCIPARTERFVRIIVGKEGEFVCKARNLGNGLMVGNCIIATKGGIGTVSLMNIDVVDKYINKIDLELDALSDFQLIKERDAIDKQILPDRLNELLKKVNIQHLNEIETKTIMKTLRNYEDLFTLKNDGLTCCNEIQHRIPTEKDTNPINVRPYRLPMSQRDEIKTQIEKMKKDGLIRPSKSAWNAPLLLVPKKAGADGIKKWRIVVDYRKLNEVTISDSFPLPNISDILDQLGKSTYFTTLDLSSGYHQVELSEIDREKTAFSTGHEHLEWMRMPMGLKSASHTFQRLMNSVLTGLHGIDCFVYLDDIVIYAKDLEEHSTKIQRIFNRLRECNLKLQPEKCNFLRREVIYLGHLITGEGIRPDPEKITCIQALAAPKNPKGIKSFLGMIGYYRRFIPDFAEKAKPLTSLLKKSIKFHWSLECEKGFQDLKREITKYPILRYPDFEEPFNITTDASCLAISAVLSQGSPGQDCPIAFASRTLLDAETRYSTSEQELLAIVWGIEHFRPYVYGTRFKVFTDHRPLVYLMNVKDPNSRLIRWKLRLSSYDFEIIHTKGKDNVVADHLSRPDPLAKEKDILIVKANDSNPNMTVLTRAEKRKQKVDPVVEKTVEREGKTKVPEVVESSDRELYNSFTNRLQLCELNYKGMGEDTELGEVKVHENNGRRTFNVVVRESPEVEVDFSALKKGLITLESLLSKLFVKEIVLNQNSYDSKSANYKIISDLIKESFKSWSIHLCIYKSEAVELFDRIKVNEVLQNFHTSPLGGHQGQKRMLSRIKSLYYWVGMKGDVVNFVRECDSCQKNKHSQKMKMPMQITTTAKRPFESIALDVVGPLNISDGNLYLLTFQDNLTKFVGAIPIQNQEAETIAREFVEQIVLKYGTPAGILTDQGTNFLSILFTNVCKLLKIKKVKASAYHPETNGSLERSHRTLKEYLRNFANEAHDNWAGLIPYCMFTLNSTRNEATGYTPFELLFGHEVFIPTSLKNKPEPVYNYDNYLFELKYKLQKAHQFAHENQIKVKEARKQIFDKKIKVDKFNVGDLVLLINSTQKGEGRKLQPLYIGPFKIIEIVSEVNCKIAIKNRHIVVHNNRLKSYTNTSKTGKSTNENIEASGKLGQTVTGKSEMILSLDQVKRVANRSNQGEVTGGKLKDMKDAFPWTQFSNPMCVKAMLKMGYIPGKGLGKTLQGIQTAIESHRAGPQFNIKKKPYTYFNDAINEIVMVKG